jgi:nucleoside-diphosphate kinase
MAIETTFAIIKPDAVEQGKAAGILAHIAGAGFNVRAIKRMHLSRAQAEGFYAEHKGRGFFDELCTFMSRSPVLVMALDAENAVVRWREVMGATDPAAAADGTIRKVFGTSKGENATHGSDSPASAARELAYFFAGLELL